MGPVGYVPGRAWRAPAFRAAADGRTLRAVAEWLPRVGAQAGEAPPTPGFPAPAGDPTGSALGTLGFGCTLITALKMAEAPMAAAERRGELVYMAMERVWTLGSAAAGLAIWHGLWRAPARP